MDDILIVYKKRTGEHPRNIRPIQQYDTDDDFHDGRRSRSIYKTDKAISFNIYRKPTATDIIIPNDSCHPPEQKVAAIILTTVLCIFIIYNSTNDCTILLLLITYNFLLHVSTLILHLQGASCAWLKLHRLLILIKLNC